MSPTQPTATGSFLAQELVLADFPVSWAGTGIQGSGFSFGSEEGKLRFTNEVCRRLGEDLEPFEETEAVNGIAHIRQFVAATTRCEIVILTLPRTADETAKRCLIRKGAHGIIATASEHFVAPIGRRGVLVIRPERSDTQTVRESLVPESLGLDLCRVISIPHQSGEVLAFAARSGGVAAIPFPQEHVSSIRLPGLDVVDVCSLDNQLAVAAVGRDCTLVFFNDVFEDAQPVGLRLSEIIRGKAYRLFNALGHIFLLASSGLYIFRELAARFLRGEHIAHMPVQTRLIPLTAVDAELVGDRWLLVVLEDKVVKFDIAALVGDTSEIQEFVKNTPHPISNGWARRAEKMTHAQPVLLGD